MSDYPKQMRRDEREVVTVYDEPNKAGMVPVRWPNGGYGSCDARLLSPLPSHDDIVQVTVGMTRAQRDRSAKYRNGRYVPGAVMDALSDACRAHRDAEEAPDA